MDIQAYLILGSFLGAIYFIFAGRLHNDTTQLILAAMVFAMFYPVVLITAVVIGTKRCLQSRKDIKVKDDFDFDKERKRREMEH